MNLLFNLVCEKKNHLHGLRRKELIKLNFKVNFKTPHNPLFAICLTII